MFLAYIVEAPNVYRILLKLLRLLTPQIEFSKIINPYDYNFVYYTIKNIDEVTK